MKIENGGKFPFVKGAMEEKLPFVSKRNLYITSIPCEKDLFDSWVQQQAHGLVEVDAVQIKNVESVLRCPGKMYRFSRPPLSSALSCEYRLYGIVKDLEFEPQKFEKIRNTDIVTWFDVDAFSFNDNKQSDEIRFTMRDFARSMILFQQAHACYMSEKKVKSCHGFAFEIEFILNNEIPARWVWEIDWSDGMKESSRIEIGDDEDANPLLFEGLRLIFSRIGDRVSESCNIN